MAKITPRTLSGFMELLPAPQQHLYNQTDQTEFGLFQGFDAQNA